MAVKIMKKDVIDVVIPIYNEEECIPELIERLLKLCKKMSSQKISFIFVNDGSKDKSEQLLLEYANKYKNIKVIGFSRNFGHQIAVTAGLDYAKADYVVIIDADLQDPPELIEQMYKKAKEGADIVYGQRMTREGETWFKKATAKLFYKLLSKLCDVNIPKDTGDFRLINSRVLNVLVSMREKHRFIRGMVPWIGFLSAPLMYHREERFAGETKYPLRKMIRFAKDAIFSFSDFPIKFVNRIGLIVVLLGIIFTMVLIYLKIFTTFSVPGITSVIGTIIILSGIQIIILGIVGEYIGRIFEESKNRPLYIVAHEKNIKKHN